MEAVQSTAIPSTPLGRDSFESRANFLKFLRQAQEERD
jgi:hypothetical protein